MTLPLIRIRSSKSTPMALYYVIQQTLGHLNPQAALVTYQHRTIGSFSSLQDARSEAKRATRRLADSLHETIYIRHRDQTVEAWERQGSNAVLVPTIEEITRRVSIWARM